MRIQRSLRIGSSFQPVANETIVGLDESLIEVKSRLCGEPSSHLEIIPIIGMGGIGKTTLARHAYEDPSTTHHFDFRAWATLSQNPDVRIILSNILCSIDPSNKKQYQRMKKELLVVRGHKYLKKRRYLIVMDDVWDTNVWDDVRRAFPDDHNGSRIIVTTRVLDVASYINSSGRPLEIQLMSEDQSWRLLKEKVFGDKNCPAKLENIGKDITKKCNGLPLAVVVIAGVLSRIEKKRGTWEKIMRNVSETINTSSDEQYYDILSLSYMHLPHHLKHCFLYMSCFPEDYEINVSRLIRLWAAEGFLVSDESKDIDELGYECLEDLARRSLVLIEKKSCSGKIKVVKIHDVLRDLCISKGKEENFLCTINELKDRIPQSIENSPRLSICFNVLPCIPEMGCNPIHTILFFSGHWMFESWNRFKLIKVLDAMTVELKSLIVELSGLIHLRYLALGLNTWQNTIPESLSKFPNLQTLVLNWPRSWCFPSPACVPIAFWRMVQIRHVILLNGFLPHPSTHDCEEALPLRNLQTLWHVRNFTCSERILELLPNLKKLGICYESWSLDETGWLKYDLKNLVHLHFLQKLNIHVDGNYNKKDLAPKVAFPAMLKRLTLCDCVIPWEDMTIIGRLPNLEVLKLKNNIHHGTIWETTEDEFCELKVLLVDNTDLQHWITESSHFPRLEQLTLFKCDSLQEIPYDFGELPTLKLIEVDIQNFSVLLSAKLIQEVQQSLGGDLKVNILESRRWKGINKFWSNISRINLTELVVDNHFS